MVLSLINARIIGLLERCFFSFFSFSILYTIFIHFEKFRMLISVYTLFEEVDRYRKSSLSLSKLCRKFYLFSTYGNVEIFDTLVAGVCSPLSRFAIVDDEVEREQERTFKVFVRANDRAKNRLRKKPILPFTEHIRFLLILHRKPSL